MAAFQFRGYWLLEPQESPDRREGIIRAYQSVLDLIAEIEAADKNDLPLKYSSWAIYMTCVAGAIYISKVVHSSYRQYLDVDGGKHAFNICLFVLRQSSVDDNDIPGRSSKLIAQIWTIHQGQAGELQKPPTVKLASRMFYSIVYDSLWQWREKWGDKPANGAPSFPPPFIPTSPSTRSTSGPPLQAPQPANAQPRPRRNTIDQSHLVPRAIGTPTGMNTFVPDLHINSPDNLATEVTEDFSSIWDIGFLNPNAPNFNLALSDFNMTPSEPFPM